MATQRHAAHALKLASISPMPSPCAARAHALKNCLSVIYAVSQLIEGDLAERSRPRLARVREAALRMSALLDDDLAAAPGQGDAVVPVADVVDAVIRRVEDHADTAGVRLVVASGRGMIRGDAADLTEALLNIVSNAIHATPATGIVTISTSSTPDGDHEWTVEDTGCGMPEEAVNRIGSAYYSAREGGSGIGVAVARDIARRHGGDVRFESAPGSGTTVTFCLPGRGVPV
jgi:signal transduction histidine kinase